MAGDKQNITIVVKAKGIKQAQAQMRALGGATNSVTGGMAGMMAKIAGVAVVVGALIRGIKASVKVFAEFEQGMANLKAISGATGYSLLQLEANAKKLGASTKFTSSEVSQLSTEFAKLGFTSKEILKATSGTLSLASAVGSDLATSAAVAGATLRGFGLDTKETGRVTDVMALSFSRSALDMAKFTDSMKYVAPVAKMAGFEVEGTTAMLGALANSGISGSMAGTALRKIFLELSNESSVLSKRLGGQVTSVEELIPALKKLSKEGVTTAEMKDMVGQRAISAFSILMNGAGTLEKLTEQLENAGGAAEHMAKIQLDTLQGKVTILNSAMSGLGIALGEQIAPYLKMVVDAITPLISSIRDFIAIPMGAKLEEDRQRVEALFTTLQDANAPLELRKQIVTELNTEYKDYLPNLVSEKDSIEDITKARKEANDSFMQAILIQAREEELQKTIEDNKDLFKVYGEAIVDTNQKKEDLVVADRQVEAQLKILRKRYGEELTQTQLLNLAKEKQKQIEDDIVKTRTQEDVNQDIAPLNQRIEAQNMSNELMDQELLALGNLVATRNEASSELDIAIDQQDRYSHEMDLLNQLMSDQQLGYDELIKRMKAKNKEGKKENDNLKAQAISLSLVVDGLKDYYKNTLQKIAIDKKTVKSSMQVGASQKNLEQAVLRASLGTIQAKITETVSTYIANWTKGMPFPANLLGIPAGAAFGQLLNQAVERQYATAKQGGAKYAEGGLITGASHSGGGVNINAEGGEFIMSRNATESIGVDNLNAMNQGGGSPNITLNISAPLVDETVTSSIVPALKDAFRRGDITNEDISNAL